MADRVVPSEVEDKEARRRASDEFSIVRANAINTYADLEHSLAQLFDTLLGAELQKSFAVFAAILNSRARLSVLERLLTLSYGDKYQVFFNSLSSSLQSIDAQRNKIVHWIARTSFRAEKEFDAEIDIALHSHPDMFKNMSLYKHNIKHFEEKVDFYRRLVFYFSTYLKFPNKPEDPKKRPWREIFHEPVAYPPPADHPLHRTRKAP